jgi:hypothetical protein
MTTLKSTERAATVSWCPSAKYSNYIASGTFTRRRRPDPRTQSLGRRDVFVLMCTPLHACVLHTAPRHPLRIRLTFSCRSWSSPRTPMYSTRVRPLCVIFKPGDLAPVFTKDAHRHRTLRAAACAPLPCVRTICAAPSNHRLCARAVSVPAQSTLCTRRISSSEDRKITRALLVTTPWSIDCLRLHRRRLVHTPSLPSFFIRAIATICRSICVNDVLRRRTPLRVRHLSESLSPTDRRRAALTAPCVPCDIAPCVPCDQRRVSVAA